MFCLHFANFPLEQIQFGWMEYLHLIFACTRHPTQPVVKLLRVASLVLGAKSPVLNKQIGLLLFFP